MPKHVMAVDDSKTMRDMVSFTLRNAGFQVTEAEDGQKALTALRSMQVDLVITDLNMPNMDGVSLIRNLRADPRYRAVPILMLTTESDPSKKAEGRAAGATGWIVKPFDPEKLVDVASRVCA
ncbi:MAG TPA: response regulator [Stellaceae bacterium]|nr:response regulator [Stellaceae bacterium]